MPQAATVEKPIREEIIVPSALRRFELPDLDRHPWILDRLLKAFPHLGQVQLIGWLRGILYQPEFHFVFQPNACGLAQVTREHTLVQAPILTERFVWAANPQDKQHVAEAAEIYGAFKKFAKDKGIEVVV